MNRVDLMTSAAYHQVKMHESNKQSVNFKEILKAKNEYYKTCANTLELKSYLAEINFKQAHQN